MLNKYIYILFFKNLQLNIAPAIGAALIGGGASLIGGYLGYKGQKDTNQANVAMSREQMAWSAKEAALNKRFQTHERLAKEKYDEQMSNTAVTRRMQDYKNAGINPILAAKFDASSPASTAMPGAMGQLPGLPSRQSAIGAGLQGASNAANTALSVMKGEQELNILKKEVNIKTYEQYIKQANELKSRIEAYMKSGEWAWKKEEFNTKEEIWRTFNRTLRPLSHKQKQAIFIGIPGAMLAMSSIKNFFALPIGKLANIVKRMLKIKPKGVTANPEQFIR